MLRYKEKSIKPGAFNMAINGAEISTLLMACPDFSLWTFSVETMQDRASDVPFLPHLYAYTLPIWLFFGALGILSVLGCFNCVGAMGLLRRYTVVRLMNHTIVCKSYGSLYGKSILKIFTFCCPGTGEKCVKLITGKFQKTFKKPI